MSITRPETYECIESTDESAVSRWHADGYARLSDGDAITYEHHLLAIAGGADPHDVYGNDETVTHHEVTRFLNTPDTLAVVERTTHRQLHQHGEWTVGSDGLPRLTPDESPTECGHTER